MHRQYSPPSVAIALLFGYSVCGYAQVPASISRALEEIVVTAEKREQSSQDVPLAISALSAATLADAGAVSMQGVTMLIPSFEYLTNNSPINTAYRIRGIGSDANIPSFEPDVGLFVDGVYTVRTGLGVDELDDIERIEVLKGPQSTLYGKNTTAGVVNVITKAPSKSFEASLDATLSDLDGGVRASAYRLSGMVSAPLTKGIRGRLSAVWYDQDPTFKNLDVGYSNTNAMKRYALRGLLDIDLPHEALLRLSFARAEMPKTRTRSEAAAPARYLSGSDHQIKQRRKHRADRSPRCR